MDTKTLRTDLHVAHSCGKSAAASSTSFPAQSQATHIVDTTMFWNERGGGVRRYLLLKRAWLSRPAGWRHTIVAPNARGFGMIDCGGLPLPMAGGYRFPLSRTQAADLIARQAPDLIEAGDPYRLAWAAIDAARALDVPVIAFCHSNLAALADRLSAGSGDKPGWARRGAEAYLRHLYESFDVVLAPSRAMTLELQRLGVKHAEHQALGVDSGTFHPSRHDPAWRASLGLPPDARVLLYVGRFAPEKNLPLLLRALDRLGPPYWLVAVGHGPVQLSGERVVVLPHEPDVHELARIYASADAFVHAGDQETFGLAALEAMASGIPLAVRASGGLQELVGDRAGIQVDSADPEDWADAIEALFDSGQGARVAAARARAVELDWRQVMPQFLARYTRLIRARRASWFGVARHA